MNAVGELQKAIDWVSSTDVSKDTFLTSLKSRITNNQTLSPKQTNWLIRKYQSTLTSRKRSAVPFILDKIEDRSKLVSYLINYTGSFTFLRDMAKQVKNGGLTANQWSAVHKCYLKDHTMQSQSSSLNFITFKAPVPVVLTRSAAMKLKAKYNLIFGPYTVEVLGAYDQVSRRGYRKYVLRVNATGAVNVCRICSKTLVDHNSVVSGIGPVCAKNLGWGNVYHNNIQGFMKQFADECAKIGNMEIEMNSWGIRDGYQQLTMAIDDAKSSGNVTAVATAPDPVPAETESAITSHIVPYDPSLNLIQVKKVTNNVIEFHITLENFYRIYGFDVDSINDKNHRFYLRNISTNNSVLFKKIQQTGSPDIQGIIYESQATSADSCSFYFFINKS